MPDTIDHLNNALEGRYRIERKLGEGGVAVVYLTDDLRRGRQVALKVLKPELAAAVGADRFLRGVGAWLRAWRDDRVWSSPTGVASHEVPETEPV